MPAYALLLRAVNVGGTGKLPMLTLRSMITAGGASEARTIGASGNAVFAAPHAPEVIATHVTQTLTERFGKPATVFTRDVASIEDALGQNPFPDADPARIAFLFLDGPVPPSPEDEARHLGKERILPGPNLLYIHYPDGMGRSKLQHPAMATGTARNLNTVRKLLDAMKALESK